MQGYCLSLRDLEQNCHLNNVVELLTVLDCYVHKLFLKHLVSDLVVICSYAESIH
jgi:hypothetical protein